MTDTQNVTEVNGTATDKQERTFTQAEVDKMVQSRIADVKGKYADYESMKEKASKFDEMEEAQKTELQKATEKAEALQKQIDSMTRANEIRSIREKVAQETGVPVSLLTADTEDACRSLANGINAYKESSRPSVAPKVKDGGESTPPTLTKADILAIKNDKARLKAIKDNIELFN